MARTRLAKRNKRRKVLADKTKGNKSNKQVHARPHAVANDGNLNDHGNAEQTESERRPRPSVWKRSLFRFIFIMVLCWLYKLYVSYRYGIDVTGSDTKFNAHFNAGKRYRT